MSPGSDAVDGRTARRNTTRAKILGAAAALFARAGFSATSVEEICEAAGVSKGSVFYNFSSKDGLAQAVIEAGINKLVHAIDTGISGRSGLDALEGAAEAILLLVAGDRHLCQVAMTELFHVGRPWQADLATYRAQVLRPIVQVLDQAHLKRRLAGNLTSTPSSGDLESSAVAFLGGLTFAALDHLVYQPDKPVRYVHFALKSSFVLQED